MGAPYHEAGAVAAGCVVKRVGADVGVGMAALNGF